MLFKRTFFHWALTSLLVSSFAHAEGNSSRQLNTSYTIELTPNLGINLPYDLWGTPGTLSTIGLRGAYNITSLGGTGALELGAFVQHADPDRAYTADAGYRYDFVQEGLNAFFGIGFHYSYFKLVADTNEDGSCVVASSTGACLTDSGAHSGIYVGGGIMMPLTPSIPVKFSMRFYNSPQLWLLLEMGMGFRF